MICQMLSPFPFKRFPISFARQSSAEQKRATRGGLSIFQGGERYVRTRRISKTTGFQASGQA